MSSRKWRSRDGAQFNAGFVVSLTMYFHIMAIALAVAKDEVLRLGRLHIVLLYVALMILNHWYFWHRKGATRLIARLSKESRAASRRDEKRLYLFIVASMALPIAVLIIRLRF